MKDSNSKLLSRILFPLLFLFIALVFRLGAVRNLLVVSDRVSLYLDAVFLFATVFFVIRLIDVLWLNLYIRRRKEFPLPLVLHSFILAVLYLAAFFIILRDILDINITPFLATSAILTMILGLAFQGVLSNIVSGMSLHFTKSFGKGDWIQVGTDEGEVIDTNWRETRIFDRYSNIVIIPNNTVASEKLTNFSYPNKKTALTIPVKVSYSAPPLDVFRTLQSAAGDIPEVMDNPKPQAHLLEYDDLGVSYRIKFWIDDFRRKYEIMAAVGKNIWYRFRRENIEIPVALNDKLLDVLGSVRSVKGIPESDKDRDRIFRSLLNSPFLRYQEGEREGELLVREDEIRMWAQSVHLSRYAPGEVVFRQGETGESCYVVARGKVEGEIIYEEKGKKYSSEFVFEPFSLFGEMSLFTGMPRTATCVVEKETELLEIRAADFAQLLKRNPPAADLMADLVSQRNKKNQAFLKKINELSDQHIKESTSKHSILTRLKSFISSHA
jgi:small-conductance mechanosensitive channel/CRP-like cAMP-binding protein